MTRASIALMLALLMGALASAAETRKEGAVTLHADRQEWVQGSMVRYEGNVEILYQDVKITCDVLELDTESMELVARGHVVLDQGPRRLVASEAQYNLRSKTGTFHDAKGAMAPTYYFTGAEVEKLDETHYRLKNATFTACEPEEGKSPPWQFHVRKALLEEEGYGRFHGTAVEVKGVPIFYLPYILWPVKTERTSGLLVPSFGYSNLRGTYMGNALYLALARSYDTTIYLDTYSKGDVGFGSEWRWAPQENAFGEIDLYTIKNRLKGSWEWRVNGRHRQDDFHGFRLLAEVHDVSDLDFFREFEHSFDRNTMRSLYSYVYLTRSSGMYSLNLRMDRRTTFFTSGDIVLNQLPEAELRVRPTRVGESSLYWSLLSSANIFNVDRGGDLKGTYGRVDAFPQLSYSLPGPPWLTVTPSVGARGTYYTSQYSSDRRSLVGEGIDRSYAAAGVDIVGPSISRIFNRGLGPYTKFKHLIEPRFEYSYVSDVGDTSRIPLFDEVDSTLVTNRVRVTLANRLLARSAKSLGAKELASLEVYQDYSFSDALSRSVTGDVTSQRGPLGAALRLTPVDGVYVDARASYSTLFSHLASTSLSASFSQGPQFLNLTWYQGYNAETGIRTSSQVRTAVGIGGGERPLRLDLEVAYDVEQHKFQQQRVIGRYQGSCWGLTVEYRDLRFGAYPSRDYRISVDFKGVGRLLNIQGGLSTLSAQ